MGQHKIKNSTQNRPNPEHGGGPLPARKYEAGKGRAFTTRDGRAYFSNPVTGAIMALGLGAFVESDRPPIKS